MRQTGSHLIMHHQDKPGAQIVVPNHGTKEIGKGLEQKIKKQAGLK
jgi:predicted RNA binding protein YcfA (HicA-like mRNA interferase family)